MIIACPHCQAQLKLPEEVEGKQVRCPSCKAEFRADPTELQAAVQAGLPAPAPTGASTPPPVPDDAGTYPIGKSRDRDEDDDEPVHRRRSYGDDDDDADDSPVRRRPVVDDDTYASAKRKTAIAGYAMLAAGFFVMLNIGVNAVMSQLAQAQMGLPPMAGGNDAAFRLGQVLGIVCLFTVFLPIIGFVFWAGGCLLRLGSRGIIITGVVMNGLILLILGAGLAINVFVLTQGNVAIPLAYVVPTIVMNSISCLLNLAAALLSIVALVQRDVVEFYAMRAERERYGSRF